MDKNNESGIYCCQSGASRCKFFGLAYAGSNYGWLEEFLAKGGGEYMDGISIHLYDDSGAFDRHWWYEKLPQLKEILVKYGMDKKTSVVLGARLVNV